MKHKPDYGIGIWSNNYHVPQKHICYIAKITDGKYNVVDKVCITGFYQNNLASKARFKILNYSLLSCYHSELLFFIESKLLSNYAIFSIVPLMPKSFWLS